jgi:K(+)-stimulated pyrophosphate-energized sodium pump
MFIIITFLTEQGLWTAFAFIIGAVISIICGAVGMIIATQTNFRTTYCAKHSVGAAFKTAYRAGVAMGFALVSLGLLSKYFFNSVLMILILVFKAIKGLAD